MRKFFVSFFSIMPNLSFILPKDPVSLPTPPATPPPNNKPSDGQPNSHTPLPDADACASLLAYSICRDSWRFALLNERQKAKIWMSSIFSIAVLLLFITAILLFTFKLFESINWLCITIAIIGGVILFITIAYYIFEFRSRKKWFEYNTDMLIQLSKPEINLIECSPKSQELMTNLINQYRYDKWMEEKKKEKTTCGFKQKFMSLFPFSIS